MIKRKYRTVLDPARWEQEHAWAAQEGTPDGEALAWRYVALALSKAIKDGREAPRWAIAAADEIRYGAWREAHSDHDRMLLEAMHRHVDAGLPKLKAAPAALRDVTGKEPSPEEVDTLRKKYRETTRGDRGPRPPITLPAGDGEAPVRVRFRPPK